MSFIPQKIFNLSDQISVYDKMGSAASAVVRRAASSSLLPRYSNFTFLKTTRLIDSSFLLYQNDSSSCAPSVNAHLVKLQECEEECDEKIREAKFAFRSTDLGSWAAFPSSAGEENTDTDPKNIQHWALVVHFPRGKKTYLFEAGKGENGLLQASRAEGVDYEIFEKAKYFGTIETCPSELLTKAKQVSTTKQSPCYNVFKNNCQTWLREFLDLISPNLLQALHKKIPETQTYLSYLAGSLGSSGANAVPDLVSQIVSPIL
jgi:hypothetical protein